MQRTLTATREEIHIQPGGPGFISTWLPVAIGLCIIFMESTEQMGGAHTSGFLRPIFTRLFGPFTDAHWELFHHLVRKSGHFIGYGTLGMTWVRAWLRSFTVILQWTIAQWRIRSASLALICTFFTASADELHQTFLPGRTGQFSDVLLDTTGALIFTLIVALSWRRQRQLTLRKVK
jgi:VanZ family protein